MAIAPACDMASANDLLAKLVDAADLKSAAFGCPGSIPGEVTNLWGAMGFVAVEAGQLRCGQNRKNYGIIFSSSIKSVPTISSEIMTISLPLVAPTILETSAKLR